MSANLNGYLERTCKMTEFNDTPESEPHHSYRFVLGVVE